MKNRLADLRVEHGVTQDALAGVVGTTRQTIISIEKERYDPGLKLAIKIARVFDLSVEEVFLLED